MAAIHMVQEETRLKPKPARMLTRSNAAMLPTPPHFYSLSRPNTPQAVFSERLVVTTYMTSGQELKTPLTPRTADQRIQELEAEVRRLKESTTSLTTNRAELYGIPHEGAATDRGMPHGIPLEGTIANPAVGSSSRPSLPQMQIDPEVLAASLQHLRASEPNSP